MQKLLDGKNALVTGGTSGIGKAIVDKFLESGANVIIFGIEKEVGENLEKEINQSYGSGRAKFYFVDVSIAQDVKNAVENTIKDFTKIDILVNNAGITRDQLLMKMTESEWDDVMDINAKSCYNTCHALIRSMMKQRSAKIINISSIIGLIGNPGQTNYAASKAAVIGFSKALAKEVGAKNISVNCIAPGFIETRMTDKLNDDQKRAIASKISFGKIGKPEDIANAALFLASPLSDYITGQVITVDGGMVI